MKRVALTLPGGGARAAYQAGVLRALAELGEFKQFPFDIITGVSAGAINGMWIASMAEDFKAGAENLWTIWRELSVNDVYKTDPVTLLSTGANWLRNLSIGEWVGKSHVNSLLDTTPLAQLLDRRMDFKAIDQHLESGQLYGVAVTATDYEFGRAVSFFEGDESIRPWDSTLFCGRRERLTRAHVMASAAIPTFFPPVRVGDCDYGDGGIGCQTPLAPSIRLGANKMLVIGVLNPPDPDEEKKNPAYHKATLGDVSGVLLNSTFLNSFDSDLERLAQMNGLVRKLGQENDTSFRNIETLVIRPSRDLSCLGALEFQHLPFTVRHLLRGLGVTDQKGWDILSYITFDKVYTRALLELGYADALAKKAELKKFFGLK